MPPPFCVTAENLEFAWRPGEPALSAPLFKLGVGEKLFIQGPSGSGKSTFLGLVAGVFEADAGSLRVLDHSFHDLSPAARDRVRADAIGVIFQQFNLVPYLSLLENVLLPCRFSKARASRAGASETEQTEAARALLERLGLGAQMRDHRAVAALSVGQQQRVAAARALIGAPSLIIADEPTSALDAASRDAFVDALLAVAADAAVLFVSHDAAIARRFDRMMTMSEINRAASAPAGAA